MKKVVLYVFVFIIFGFTIKPETARVPQIQLLTTKSTFQVGESIQLKFKTEASDLKLLLASNLGTMLVSPETQQAIKTFKVNKKNIELSLSKNPILVTALNPVIGYAKAASIAKKAYKENRPIIEVALEDTELTSEQLKRILNPKKLTQGGINKK